MTRPSAAPRLRYPHLNRTHVPGVESGFYFWPVRGLMFGVVLATHAGRFRTMRDSHIRSLALGRVLLLAVDVRIGGRHA